MFASNRDARHRSRVYHMLARHIFFVGVERRLSPLEYLKDAGFSPKEKENERDKSFSLSPASNRCDDTFDDPNGLLNVWSMHTGDDTTVNIQCHNSLVNFIREIHREISRQIHQKLCVDEFKLSLFSFGLTTASDERRRCVGGGFDHFQFNRSLSLFTSIFIEPPSCYIQSHIRTHSHSSVIAYTAINRIITWERYDFHCSNAFDCDSGFGEKCFSNYILHFSFHCCATPPNHPSTHSTLSRQPSNDS